jgi:hypothetical protein
MTSTRARFARRSGRAHVPFDSGAGREEALRWRRIGRLAGPLGREGGKTPRPRRVIGEDVHSGSPAGEHRIVSSRTEGALAFMTSACSGADRLLSATAAGLLLARLAVAGKMRALAGLGQRFGECRSGHARRLAALAGRCRKPQRECRDEHASKDSSGAEAAHRRAYLALPTPALNRVGSRIRRATAGRPSIRGDAEANSTG